MTTFIKFFRFSLLLLLTLFSAIGCSSSTQVSYQPPFLPITFSIDSNGNISFQATASVVTELGTFSISESASSSSTSSNDTMLLTILHYQNGFPVQTVYQIQTEGDPITVITNGQTIIQITHNAVTIDTRGGNIESITLASSTQQFSTSLSTFCLNVEPQALTLFGIQGQYQSNEQPITITNCAGVAETWTSYQKTNDGNNWIRTTNTSSTLCPCSSQHEGVLANLYGLPAGTYTGYLTYYVGSNKAATVTVTLVVNY